MQGDKARRVVTARDNALRGRLNNVRHDWSNRRLIPDYEWFDEISTRTVRSRNRVAVREVERRGLAIDAASLWEVSASGCSISESCIRCEQEKCKGLGSFNTEPLLRPKESQRREESKTREGRKKKTYSSWDSHVVTHRSTNQPVNCLCMAERTGCPVFSCLWPYVLIMLAEGVYIPRWEAMGCQ